MSREIQIRNNDKKHAITWSSLKREREYVPIDYNNYFKFSERQNHCENKSHDEDIRPNLYNVNSSNVIFTEI